MVDTTGLLKELIPFLENILKVVVFVAGLMILFSIWRINLMPLVACAGIASAAVTFAAKDAMANFSGEI